MNIVKLTIFLTFASLGDASRLKCKTITNSCGENAEMREQCGCGDASCANPIHSVCPQLCRQGCFCLSGFVRDAGGNCIALEKCPPKGPNSCGINESYNSCGSACGDYDCDNYQKYLLNPPICTANCVSGCYCNEGYVQDILADGSHGQCINYGLCPCVISDTCKLE